MEKMIKLNKSKIAELIAKKHLTVKMVADGACLAYTTAKHIIQEGRDCVEATSVDKVERLAKALGATSQKVTPAVTALVKSGDVVLADTVKRVNYYTVA